MSGGFSFPPPPPAPPRAATESNNNAQPSFQNRRGRLTGGDRGRYDGQPRSRGNHQRGRGQFHGNDRRSQQGVSMQSQLGMRAPPHTSQHHHWTTPALVPGAFVNPNFGPLNGPPGDYDRTHLFPPASPTSSSYGPPRTVAGHKRKLDVLRPPQQEPTRPGPQAAPAVPSFGTPILLSNPDTAVLSEPQAKQKSSPNALGLTPGAADPQYSSSDEGGDDKDVDEEAMFAELGTKLTFEHNGVVMSLNSASDLAAWQEERKKNWPSKARVAQKNAEKRRIGEERKRLLASAASLEQGAIIKTHTQSDSGKMKRLAQSDSATETASAGENYKPEPQSKLDEARRELAEQTKRLEALRKKVAEGQASLERAQSLQAEQEQTTEVFSEVAHQNVPPGADEVEQNSGASSVLSESSVLSSDASSEAGVSTDDESPEEASSKPLTPAVHSERPVCKFYQASGYCREGDACRFRHELLRGASKAPPRPQRPPLKLATETSAQRQSIYQRLLQQQLAEEDKLALQVIKYLGKAEFFQRREYH